MSAWSVTLVCSRCESFSACCTPRRTFLLCHSPPPIDMPAAVHAGVGLTMAAPVSLSTPAAAVLCVPQRRVALLFSVVSRQSPALSRLTKFVVSTGARVGAAREGGGRLSSECSGEPLTRLSPASRQSARHTSETRPLFFLVSSLLLCANVAL